MIKGSKMCNSYPEKFYDNSGCITDSKSIAQGFNTFFTNVGPALASKIKAPCVPQSIFKTMGSRNLKSMFLKPVKELELFNIINSCKSKHSTDVDDLSMYIVKSTFKAIAKPFMYICNMSFSTGVFPTDLKTAKNCSNI